jgi:hypothetical protein
MYTLKKIAEKNKTSDTKYKNIIDLHDKLSLIDSDNPDFSSLKKKKLKELSNMVLKILDNKTKDLNVDNYEKNQILKDISDISSTSNFENEYKITGGAEYFNNKDYLQNFSKKIENIILNKNDTDNVKISKYKDILNEVDTIINPIESLNINREDKILFIIITFIIRLIVLSIVSWSINTNYVNNFSNAMLLYSSLYIIILFIICTIVNISYNYNTNSIIYGNTGFSFLANSLYYFYLIPGGNIKRNGRLFIHTFFLIIFTIIPFSLNNSSDNNNIDYDYNKKKETISLLNNYTLVILIFTSIIAINY